MSSQQPVRREITVRRAPRFIPFLIAGAVVGFIVALFLAYTGPEDPNFTRESSLGFLTMILIVPGVTLGGLVAVLLDALSVRHSRRAIVEEAGDEPDDDAGDPDADARH